MLKLCSVVYGQRPTPISPTSVPSSVSLHLKPTHTSQAGQTEYKMAEYLWKRLR